MDNGHNLQARQLAVQLCRMYLVDEKSRNIVSEVDFSNTLETLTRVYQSRQNAEGYVVNIFFTNSLVSEKSFLFNHIVFVYFGKCQC